jgi:hypothetical protein
LPPTIGTCEYDDLTVHSVRVEYGVKARIIVGVDKNGKPKAIKNRHQVRVLPCYPEQPPLHISPKNPGFHLSHEKMIRKDLMSPKIGTLRASISQPDCVVISVDRLTTSESSLVVDLEFTPTPAKVTPPDIYAKSACIQAITYYSLDHIGYLPDQHKRPTISPTPVLPYCMHNDLILGQRQKLAWEKPPESYSWRSSGEPAVSQDSATYTYWTGWSRSSQSDEVLKSRATTYKTTLIVPFKLPTSGQKLFLPTFYSCLVCRVYTIQLILAEGSHGSSLSLTVPLQIAAKADHTSQVIGPPAYVSALCNRTL